MIASSLLYDRNLITNHESTSSPRVQRRSQIRGALGQKPQLIEISSCSILDQHLPIHDHTDETSDEQFDGGEKQGAADDICNSHVLKHQKASTKK